jgi:hypothetical protein
MKFFVDAKLSLGVYGVPAIEGQELKEGKMLFQWGRMNFFFSVPFSIVEVTFCWPCWLIDLT